MKRLAHITVAILSLLASHYAHAGVTATKEQLVKAAFIYNFAKFITWPTESFVQSNGKLRICADDKDSLGGALIELENRPAQRKLLEIHYLTGNQEVDRTYCHMLYINGSGKAIPTLLTQLAEGPVVVIRESLAHSRPTGTIIFRRVDNKLRFDVDLEEAKSKGIDISSFLLKLALNVYD